MTYSYDEARAVCQELWPWSLATGSGVPYVDAGRAVLELRAERDQLKLEIKRERLKAEDLRQAYQEAHSSYDRMLLEAQRAGWPPRTVAEARRIAENERLRVAFEALKDEKHRIWDGGHSVSDLYDMLRAAVEGGA